MMFDNFQAYDVQEIRRISREEGRLEGKIEGETLYLIKQVIKRIELQFSAPQISESLLEPLEIIQPIYDLAIKQAPDYDAESILDTLNNSNFSAH